MIKPIRNTQIGLDYLRLTENKAGEELEGINNNIQPVLIVGRSCDFFGKNQAINSTSAVIVTTPTDKDTFITNAQISLIKDVTATSIISRIQITQSGVIRYIGEICGLTLTPQQDSMSMYFNPPIKVDRGTSINVVNSTNVGNVSCSACVQGYTVETKS